MEIFSEKDKEKKMRVGNDKSLVQSRQYSGTEKRGSVPSPDYTDFHFNKNQHLR
jgi:hypothetical protein